MNSERHLWINFVFCLLFGFVLATKCEFCNKDFTCVNRHTWRCPACITSSRPIDAHDVRTSPPVLQDKANSSNDRDSNTRGQGEIVNNEVVKQSRGIIVTALAS